MDLAPIEAEHDRIAADFSAHQQALVRAVGQASAGSDARSAWDRFETRLRAHIRFEDEQLIPLFSERVQPPPMGCTEELLLAEHRKLERLLDRCGEAVREHLEQRAADPAALLALIEQQRMIREVLEHHDQRERAAFFPALHDCLLPDEKAALLQASLAAHPAV
jgi:hemerythrin-like domain-containing protein